MKALRFERKGDLDGLQVVEMAEPQPGPDEVLIEVRGASINPSDVKNVMGAMSQTTTPRVPGRDFAGTVRSGAQAGLEVWGSAGSGTGYTRDGTHAQYFVLAKNALVKRPYNISVDQAAAAGLQIITAWETLLTPGELKAGETVLVFGASGGVGRFVCQLAKRKGCRVVGVKKEAGTVEFTDATVASTSANFREMLKQAIGEGAQVVVDTVSGPMFEIGLESLADGGRMSVITIHGEKRVSFDLLDFYRRELRLFGVNTLNLSSEQCAKILREANPLIESGVLVIPQPEPVPLGLGVQAYKRASEGHKRKIVLHPRNVCLTS
jgi:NADPH:quinone reductase-like Zn-dependent oxidoreductase